MWTETQRGGRKSEREREREREGEGGHMLAVYLNAFARRGILETRVSGHANLLKVKTRLSAVQNYRGLRPAKKKKKKSFEAG